MTPLSEAFILMHKLDMTTGQRTKGFCVFTSESYIDFDLYSKHIFFKLLINKLVNSLFSHLEILVDAQGWLVEVYLDDGDPITQQIPLSPSNVFYSKTMIQKRQFSWNFVHCEVLIL